MASPFWRPTAHLVLPSHIRLEVAPQSQRDRWKWFEARLLDSLFSDHAVGNGWEAHVGSPLAAAPHANETVPASDAASAEILHSSIFSVLLAPPTPLSARGWLALSRYPCHVSLSQVIRLPCASSTLTYWGIHFLARCLSKSAS